LGWADSFPWETGVCGLERVGTVIHLKPGLMKPERGVCPGHSESFESFFTTDKEIGRRVEEALERQPLNDQPDKPQAFLILHFCSP